MLYYFLLYSEVNQLAWFLSSAVECKLLDCREVRVFSDASTTQRASQVALLVKTCLMQVT